MSYARWYRIVAAVTIYPVSVAAQAQSLRVPLPGAPTGVTAFVNVAVIPMDSARVLEDQTVLVTGGWITALGPASRIKVPAGAVRIDGQGKFLLPGLADMHAHISFDWVGDRGASLPLSIDSILERRLFLVLASGVTTIRNLDYESTKGRKYWLVDGHDLLRLRARAAAGELLSPRLYVSSQWAPTQYVLSRGILDTEGFADLPAPKLDSVPAYVAAYKAAGYDHLKVRNESPEVWAAVLPAARQVGMPVVGHMIGERDAALVGMRSIEHMGGIDPAPAATQENDAATVTAFTRAKAWHVLTMQTGFRDRRRLIKPMQNAGVGLLLGSDAPWGYTRGAHRELEIMVTQGSLSPYEALVTGTRNVAAYLGTLDETGTVAVGKRADLLLLNSNPLVDIRSTRQSAGVMLGGRWLTRTELDQRAKGILDSGGVGRGWGYELLFPYQPAEAPIVASPFR